LADRCSLWVCSAQVRQAANASLKRFGEVIHNPEIKALVPTLLKALVDPTSKTSNALTALLNTSFSHFIDSPSLALVSRSLLLQLKPARTVGSCKDTFSLFSLGRSDHRARSTRKKRYFEEEGRPDPWKPVSLFLFPFSIALYELTPCPSHPGRRLPTRRTSRPTSTPLFRSSTSSSSTPFPRLEPPLRRRSARLLSDSERLTSRISFRTFSRLFVPIPRVSIDRCAFYPSCLPSASIALTSLSGRLSIQGAAQGLSEVLSGLGMDRMEGLLPEVITNASSPRPYVREGFISLLIYLPATFGHRFAPHLGRIIPPILGGLADDSEFGSSFPFHLARYVPFQD
jgi:hypothetical protein